MYLFIFIHSSINGHIGRFPILAIVNNAAINISLHTSFLVSVFVFFGKILRSEFAKLMVSQSVQSPSRVQLFATP